MLEAISGLSSSLYGLNATFSSDSIHTRFPAYTQVAAIAAALNILRIDFILIIVYKSSKLLTICILHCFLLVLPARKAWSIVFLIAALVDKVDVLDLQVEVEIDDVLLD